MKGVELTWAGGEHEFVLTIELLRALQSKCDAGPPHILERLTSRRWFVDDVIEPIRLGLEGGGATKEAARQMVKRFVEDRPLTESVILAHTVLSASLLGSEDDMPGEMKAGTASQTVTRSPEENGASPASTDGPV